MSETKLPDWWHSDEETFMRHMTAPEEDRWGPNGMRMPYNGGFRWFRSPNVVCIEKIRRAKCKRDTDGTAA
jgi:hypothetical protein